MVAQGGHIGPPLNYGLQPSIFPRLSPSLIQKADVFKGHPLVHGLAHVIYRKECSGNGGKGLHLNPCLTRGLYPGLHIDGHKAVVVRNLVFLEAYVYAGEEKWMTHWNNLRCLLCPHYAGHLRHSQDITLLHLSFQDELQRLGFHTYPSSRNRNPPGCLFTGHIHHPCPSLWIKVCKPFHAIIMPP